MVLRHDTVLAGRKIDVFAVKTRFTPPRQRLPRRVESGQNDDWRAMQHRTLGRTGLAVSRLAFGAGPVPALLTGDDPAASQRAVAAALAAGINWFDTAATYGDGQSERMLGHALQATAGSDAAHVATKVRFTTADMDDVAGAVRRSLEASLERLGRGQVTLLQLHNSITLARGDEPTSITPHDVLAPGGVADALDAMRDEGLVRHIGLTGIGHPAALHEVIRSSRFDTVQTPYHLLNTSAGEDIAEGFAETNYGNLIAECARQQMGVFAIRVFAGGALLGQPPSQHTHRTKFFPLDLYQRDRQRAAAIEERLLEGGQKIDEVAVRFALSHPDITAAIVGFGERRHVDEAVGWAEAGPLSGEQLNDLSRYV